MPLEGRKCVVTGGTRGIGAAVVCVALAQGADVVFSYLNGEEAARDLCAKMSAAYPDQRCTALRADVRDGVQAQAFATEASDAMGGVDMLVNNAGVKRDATFARMSREQWDEVLDTNLHGLFNVTRPLVMPLVRGRGSSVVNITSASGLHGAPGQAAYSASKAGIIGFTKALAKEVGAMGVTVNAVAPGLIDTDMIADLPPQQADHLKSLIPTGRFGSAEDVAHLVCYLASARARYITGQVIEMSGGLLL
ncbi:MAG: 3-oxoacyl-ACP reductase FabG [Streptomycetaceae bacterium]|nr:3-oxoacyl-ACP reductase FabG [Streptomycetaceae bacterium]